MDEFLDEIEIPNIDEVDEIKDGGEKIKNNGKLKAMKPLQKELEKLYADFERMKTEARKHQDIAKELKEGIITLMTENGYDEIIVNGLDTIVMLAITYPEHEILNKKALAEKLGITQKELSKPEIIIQLTKEGRITAEMIEEFTITEERMLFSASEYKNE